MTADIERAKQVAREIPEYMRRLTVLFAAGGDVATLDDAVETHRTLRRLGIVEWRGEEYRWCKDGRQRWFKTGRLTPLGRLVAQQIQHITDGEP